MTHTPEAERGWREALHPRVPGGKHGGGEFTGKGGSGISAAGVSASIHAHPERHSLEAVAAEADRLDRDGSPGAKATAARLRRYLEGERWRRQNRLPVGAGPATAGPAGSEFAARRAASAPDPAMRALRLGLRRWD